MSETKEPEMAGLDAVRERLEAIVYEMAGIIPDPSAENPDWMLALGNSNTADAECLNKAYNAAREALALLESEQGEQIVCGPVALRLPIQEMIDRGWLVIQDGKGWRVAETAEEVDGALARLFGVDSVEDVDAILGTPTESEGE